MLRLLIDPHTPDQIRKRSRAFETPFLKVEHVRRRLRELRENSLIQSFDYLCVRESYHKLTRIGFQMLFPGVTLPHSRFFGPVSYGSQPHTHGVIETISCLERLLSFGSVQMLQVATEPQLKAKVDEEVKLLIKPDAEFSIKTDGKTMNYFLEYDCGTEPVVTKRGRESLSRKVTRYDQYSLDSNKAFKVLMVFQSELRQQHFLDMVEQTISNPKGRTLFYGTTAHQLRKSATIDELPLIDHRRQQWTLGKKRSSTRVNFIKKELAHAA